VEGDGPGIEEDELERHRIVRLELDIGIAVVGAAGDGDGDLRGGAVAHQPLLDRGDQGRIAHLFSGRVIDRGEAGGVGRRVLHVGIGVEHPADLAYPDDERDQHRCDERELDGADAALVAAEKAFQDHWVLTAPVALMRMVEK
jgi:hypothetical protein